MAKKISTIGTIAGAVLVLLLILAACFADALTNHDPIEMSIADRLSPPSSTYPFGTDNMGRDIQTRIVYGLRTNIGVGALAALMALIVGGMLGVAAGLLGGMTNKAVVCLARFLAAGPGVLLVFVVLPAIGFSSFNSAIAISILLVPSFIHVIRGVVLFLSDTGSSEDKRALKALGAVAARISSSVALAMLVMAGLGYLGIGAQPPTPELGAMFAAGREFFRTATHLVTYPGLALFVSVIPFHLLGGSLNRLLLAKGYDEAAPTGPIGGILTGSPQAAPPSPFFSAPAPSGSSFTSASPGSQFSPDASSLGSHYVPTQDSPVDSSSQSSFF